MSLAPFLGGSDPVMALIFFGMVLILVVDIFLVRLLSKMVNASLASSTQSHGTQRSVPVPHQAPYLRPQTTSGLHPASVTESTTRFFEPQPLRPETADPAAGQKLKP
jgi:hypothetical protein